MLTIAIDTAKGVHQFDWDATAEEFQRLCEKLEGLAADEGRDPRDIAAAAIHTTAAKGADNDPVRQRGQATWIARAGAGTTPRTEGARSRQKRGEKRAESHESNPRAAPAT